MRHNPAASFDLGMHAAAGGYEADDIEWFAKVSQMWVDQATLEMAARRFERFEAEHAAWAAARFNAWVEAQSAA